MTDIHGFARLGENPKLKYLPGNTPSDAVAIRVSESRAMRSVVKHLVALPWGSLSISSTCCDSLKM